MRLLRLFAATSWSSGTSFGSSECCAPAPNANAATVTNTPTKHGHTCGSPEAVFARMIAVPTIIPHCCSSISRRRSNASASAPPTSVIVSIGMSSVSASRPTASVEPVSAYTWYDSAT